MSGWLCYTRKMLATAIATIAEELEQTAVDLNDAVETMRKPGEEQILYSSFNANSDDHASCATTQQPVTSSVLPTNVVPGDPVLEDHFSFPTTSQLTMEESPLKDSPKDEVICRTTECQERSGVCTTGTPSISRSANLSSSRQDLASSLVLLGDKRPGRVIRTSTGDFCDLMGVDDCDVPMQSGDDMDNQPGAHERLEDADTHPAYSERRWYGPFSRVMTFAYAQVTNAVFTMMDESSDGTTSIGQDEMSSPNTRTLHIQVSSPNRPGDLPLDPNTACSQLTVEVLESPRAWEECGSSESRCLVSPVSIHSTYSSDSFEIIDPSLMDRFMDATSSDNEQTALESNSKPIFIVGEMDTKHHAAQEKDSSQNISSDMSSSSAEHVNFNFSNLISGRYFSTRSPEPCLHGQKETTDTTTTVEQSVGTTTTGGIEPQPCSTDLYTVHVNVHSDDDDGSSSFDILSEPSEEDFVLN